MHIQKHIYMFRSNKQKIVIFNLNIIYTEYWLNFINFSRTQL